MSPLFRSRPRSPEEWVRPLLDADSGRLAVARIHHGLVRESKEHVADRSQKRLQIAARKIRAPDGAGKQGVSDKERPSLLLFAADREAHTSRAVSGCVVHPGAVV